MDHFLSDAKRLVNHLQSHDNAVDILISETTNLQNKLIAMRQYRDEVNKMNQAANHRPRSTLILGSQLENQKIQNLEQENRELSLSLAEHQSALELIMNKYREQVLGMMKGNGSDLVISKYKSQPTEVEIMMSEKIAEMAYVMRRSASIDESVATMEVEALRRLQVENDNLRELLEISGKHFPLSKHKNLLPMQNGFANNPENHLENVTNKDSGIYDEILSPNKDVLIKAVYKPPQRMKSKSKHIDSLERLFHKPDTEKDTNDEDFGSEEDSTYKLYTVERFVPKDDFPQDESSNVSKDDANENEEFLDIFPKNKIILQDFQKCISTENVPGEKNDTKLNLDSLQKDDDHIQEPNTEIDKVEILDDVDDALSSLDDALSFDIEDENDDDYTTSSDLHAAQEDEYEGDKLYETNENTTERYTEAPPVESPLNSSHVTNNVLESNQDTETNERLQESVSSKQPPHLNDEPEELSDVSSECSEVTVIDNTEFGQDEESTITSEDKAMEDIDAFLDDQFDLGEEMEEEEDEE